MQYIDRVSFVRINFGFCFGFYQVNPACRLDKEVLFSFIAQIVEPILAKKVNEEIGLIFRLSALCPICDDHAIEKADEIRERLRRGCVIVRAEQDLARFGPLAGQEVDDFLM